VNEWQEGSYIEPNEEFGFSMYDALRDAFCSPPPEGFPKNMVPADVGSGPYDYPPMEHPDRTSWIFADDFQGWYRNPYGTAHLRIADGALRFFRSGTHLPAIRTRVKPFDAKKFRRFTICMRITRNVGVPPQGNERMTLFWGTPEHPIFSKELTLNFDSTASIPVVVDGEFHDYSLVLEALPLWNGMVEELWLDPIPLSLAYVDIRWMRFE
jgi:hypothetical protein